MTTPDSNNSVAGQGNSPNKDGAPWWQAYSTVIAAILSVTIVAVRLLLVARGDPETAYAILQAGGTGTVLIGTLISTLGLLAIPAVVVLIVSIPRAGRRSDNSIQTYALGAAAAIIFSIAFYEAAIILLVPGIILVVIAVFLRIFKSRLERVGSRLARREHARLLLYSCLSYVYSHYPVQCSNSVASSSSYFCSRTKDLQRVCAFRR